MEHNKGLIVLVVILILLQLGLGGYFIYDRLISSETNDYPCYSEKQNNRERSLSYIIEATDSGTNVIETSSGTFPGGRYELVINDSGSSLVVFGNNGNEIFRNHITTGNVFPVTRDNSGNFIVIYSFINYLHTDEDEEQGLFAIVYDKSGEEIKSITLLRRNDITYSMCPLNPGWWAQNVGYDVLGVVNNKIYFVTASNDENPLEYLAYLNIVDLNDESRTRISLNNALDLNDVSLNHNFVYLNETDSRVIFQTYTRVIENDRETTNARFVVYDINQEEFLATNVIERLSNERAPHIFPIGNYRFLFDLNVGGELAYKIETYIITLVFEGDVITSL